MWELKVSKRCTDPWFTDVLTQCRNGKLELEDYFFLHGKPTLMPGSTIRGKLTCDTPKCVNLAKQWEKRFIDYEQMFADAKKNPVKKKPVAILTGEDLNSKECKICKKHREARTVVAMSDKDVRFNEEPFSTAPYIHQLNEPKHAANLERAVKWAGVNKRSINWVTAHDYPLHRDDQAGFFFCDTSPQCSNKARLYALCNVNATHTHIYIYILLRLWTRIVWTRNAGAGFSSTTKRPAGSWAYCRSSKVYPCA